MDVRDVCGVGERCSEECTMGVDVQGMFGGIDKYGRFGDGHLCYC